MPRASDGLIKGALELAVMMSPIGHLLPTILSLQAVEWLEMTQPEQASELQGVLAQLTVVLDKVAVHLPMEERSAGEQKFVVPKPWAAGTVLESIHPVRDSYKFQDTVTIKGSKAIYLRFDPKCSTQYDYDKVQIYSGHPKSLSYKKVTEYGVTRLASVTERCSTVAGRRCQ